MIYYFMDLNIITTYENFLTIIFDIVEDVNVAIS
jgi:hypothetical protein